MVTAENTQLIPMENVCVADEVKVLCVVRDMIDPACSGIKHSFNLPASMSVAQVIRDVCAKFAYVQETVSILYSRQLGGEIEEVRLEEHLSSCLGDICNGPQRRHDLNISDRDGFTAQKVEQDTTTDTVPVQETGDSVASTSSAYYSCGASSTSSDVYSFSTYPDNTYSYASALMKSDTGYVGLVNQAMTCYLNSLLQTLYMTPEFRNAIYRWEFDGSEEEAAAKSIPYQLQKLFLQLQTSKKRAAETTDLTRSFGWDSSEVWQQHDVQELCRVMFDALELKWKNTDQAHLINHLYQGKMKDYVKCLECNNESARMDAYLDIPLVIRPFGSTTAYGSVEEALNAFVQPETLEGSNQYFCEKCNKKCDAHKGFKFVSFPYLLTLQFKRFDFDYNTMHRIKLNDRMSFQDILNLNHLVEDQEMEKELSTAKEATKDRGDTTSNGPMEDSSDEGIDVSTESEIGAAGRTPDTEDSRLSSEAVANDKNAKEMECKGPYVYELFSIMVHSGSAAGGHYYAYIKSFKDGQWYSFNDQHVSKITYDEITKTYGGSTGPRGYYSATYSSSTNAYMLMYRQIDKQRNSDFIQPDNFPEHVKRQLQQLKDKEEAERRQKELDKSTCKIKVFCYHPVQKKKLEHKLEVHKDKTLAEATEIVYKLFDLQNTLTLDCCRLVKYDEYQDTLERSFEEDVDTPMGKILGGIKQNYNFDLLLETKRPEQHFQEYKPGGVTIKVFVADLEAETIQDPVSVRAYHQQTVTEFKHIVAEVLNVSVDHMRCVLERFHNELKYLCVPNKTLKAEGFFKSNKVYIEFSGTENDNLENFLHSKFYKLLDRHQNTIRIHVNLPSSSEVSDFMKMSIRQSHLMEKTGIRGTSTKSMENIAASVTKSGHKCSGHDPLDIDEGISDRGSDSEVDYRIRSLTLQHSLSDPSIYHNCQALDRAEKRFSPKRTRVKSQGHSNSIEDLTQDKGVEVRTSSPVTGQSSCSQETSTSAEFSLNTNCSVEEGVEDGVDLDNPPGDSVDRCYSDSEQTYPPSPGERTVSDTDFKREPIENWDTETSEVDTSDSDVCVIQEEEPARRYFNVVNEELDVLTKHRHLTVLVDKRITLGAFKKELEPFVDTTVDNFKVFRVYSNNQEFESIRLSETMSFFEDGKLNIKLGRALKPGEYRVKVYLLQINETEPSKFLIDTIFAKGMSVLESKKLILPEIKAQCDLDIDMDRCRLRKKTWKNPGTVYIDSQLYEDDLPIFANWEVFIQILEGPEKMISTSQLAIFVRRWCPSTFKFEPFQEIVLSHHTVEELKQKLSEISGVAEENIEYAKGRGTFPCDISILEIHSDLEWNPFVTTLNSWPLYICDDGNVLYYRDKNEDLMELSEDKKKEIQQKENARLSRNTGRSSYSPRKEKALKIYTDDHPNYSSKSSLELD